MNHYIKLVLLCLFVSGINYSCSMFNQNSSSSSKYVTISAAKKKSINNRSEKKGYKEGFEDGEQAGYQEGLKKGEELGKQIGIVIGEQNLLKTFKDSLTDWEYMVHMHDYYELRKKVIDIENAFEKGKIIGEEEGCRKDYVKGFQYGYATAFDSLMNIHLKRGNALKLKTTTGTLLHLDYEKVAQLMGGIEDNKIVVDAYYFSTAVRNVHIEILNSLIAMVILTKEEKEEIFERYDEIHDKLANIYYQRYLKECATLNRNYQKSFYDYRYYVSANVFTQIINGGVCSVADVVFTYAKNNSQYATVTGFDVMGHICELIHNNLMVTFSDYLIKNAVRLDYNKTQPTIIQSVQNIILPSSAEIRKHCKTIKEVIQVKPGFTAEVEMEIETIIELGYETNEVDLSINHKKQVFELTVAPTPRFIRTIYQSYKVLSIKNSVNCNSLTCYEHGTIRKKDLEVIFNTHRDDPKTLIIAKTDLKNETMEKLIPLLKKVIEPCVSLPYSCYSADYYYGKQKEQLISIKCK